MIMQHRPSGQPMVADADDTESTPTGPAPGAMPAVLACRHVGHSVGAGVDQLHILRDISLELETGASLAITGTSGSGKTTLLGLLAGLDVASSGHIEMFGQPLQELDEEQRAALRRNQVGFVFQSFHLIPTLTALDNVLLPLELTARSNARERALEALERVGLSARLRHYPGKLSGGEQQRVALARAFASDPKLLFADEPTGNLDHVSGNRVIELLFELNHAKATALVLVTHDLQLASHCDRHARLQHGMLVWQD